MTVLCWCIEGGELMIDAVLIAILLHWVWYKFTIISDKDVESVSWLNCDSSVPVLECHTCISFWMKGDAPNVTWEIVNGVHCVCISSMRGDSHWSTQVMHIAWPSQLDHLKPLKKSGLALDSFHYQVPQNPSTMLHLVDTLLSSCYIWVECSARLERKGCDQDILLIDDGASASSTRLEHWGYGSMGDMWWRGRGRFPRRMWCSGGSVGSAQLKLDWHKNSDLGSEVGIGTVLNSTTHDLMESVVLLTK